MNYERKALDLAREHKGVSALLLMRKLKITHDLASELAKSANEEYIKRQENKQRTRFKRKNEKTQEIKLEFKEDLYHEERIKDAVNFFEFCENHNEFISKKEEFIKECRAKGNHINAVRRTRMQNNGVAIDKHEIKLIRDFYKNRPEGYHVDHIIPIAKGGQHCLSNLQYLPAIENIRKKDKLNYQKVVSHVA